MNDSGWIETGDLCRRRIGPYELRSMTDGSWTILLVTKGAAPEYETAVLLRQGCVVLSVGASAFTCGINAMDAVTRSFRAMLTECLEVIDAP